MMAQILNPPRFTGWHMFGVLALFFGVTIVVNVVLAVFANGSWTGLVVKSPYIESQHYNERIANEERQTSLGWTGTFVYDNATVSLYMTNRSGEPVAVDEVFVTLRRPAAEQQDHRVQLHRVEEGLFAAPHPLPTGLWAADVRVDSPGYPAWVKRYRFTVTANETDTEALAE